MRCPVEDRERIWIEQNLQWLRGQFGDAPLSAAVVLPTSDFFPPPFSGSDEDVRAAVRAVARYMGVQADLDVRFADDLDQARRLARVLPCASSGRGAAGSYGGAAPDGRLAVTIDRSNADEPARLLAVIAHELGHVRLLGERRIGPDRKDGEPLTDLATVYLGMGIFTANASFDFGLLPSEGFQRIGGWQARRLGYMTEQMFGYALARYAVLRGEPDPPWARYLDTNPRVYMKHGIRYLDHLPAGTDTTAGYISS